MEQSSSKTTVAPLTLLRLLDTQQATAVIPGVLYFATTGECLASSNPTASIPNAAATVPDVWGVRNGSESAVTTTAAAVRDFFLKENPWAEAHGAAALRETAIPSTSAAIGLDAVFIAPRGTPPYLYRPFFADFGPLDLGCCVHFTRRLRQLLLEVSNADLAASVAAANSHTGSISADIVKRATLSTTRIGTPDQPPSISASSATAAARALPVVICASLNAQERANTACLVGAFCILALGWSTALTWSRVFANVYPSFLTYRDASTGVSNYPLTLQDVWSGLEQAAQLGWVAADAFDLPAYWEGKEKDFSWIVPQRFLAMSSPRDAEPQRAAEVFAARLRAMNVRLVIRLNDSLYSPAPLLRLGIRHVDLPYADGSTPNDATLLRFLQAVEAHFGEEVSPSSLRQWWSVPTAGVSSASGQSSSAAHKQVRLAKAEHRYAACSLLHSGTYRGMPNTRTAVPQQRPVSRSSRVPFAGELGAVAVHCLAGLGRTGTMIAVYMMRHYGFTARGVIGWMRLCRPGSITGVQQQYLDTIERRLRPSPYIVAAQRLRDYVQTLHPSPATTTTTATAHGRSPSSSSSASSASALAVLSPSNAPRGLGVMGRSLGVPGGPSTTLSRTKEEGAKRAFVRAEPVVLHADQPWHASAVVTGIAAYQTHGNVVGDARPLTGLGGDARNSGNAYLGAAGGGGQHRESGQWAEASLEGGPHGLLLRRPPQQRRRTSTGSLSFTTDQPDIAALDAVSSMPILGAGAQERLRSGIGHVPAPSAAATVSGQRFSATVGSSSSGGGAGSGGGGTATRALPRVGDYKYASTYFLALERANGRSPPRSNGGGSSIATSNSTSASASPAGPKGSAGRGRANVLGSTYHNNSARASTANATSPRRSNRLDTYRQQQRRISTGSFLGLDPLRRGASFGRKPSLSHQRRVSMMSATIHHSDRNGESSTARYEGSGSSTGNTASAGGEWLVDALDGGMKQRPHTTASVSPIGITTPARAREAHGRLRKTLQTCSPAARRLLSLRSASSLLSCPPSDMEHTQENLLPELPNPRTGIDPAVRSHEMQVAMPRPPQHQRYAGVPQTVLPLWGRPVGPV